MNAYKIRVNNEPESKEAQGLFFELGFRWKWSNKREILRESIPYLFTEGKDIFYGVSLTEFDKCDGKELTLSKLRDLVVLKRNDVKDATHTGTGDSKYYVDSNGDSYIHNSIIWTEWKLDISILKPISQPQYPALISGRDAWLANFDGKKVQFKNIGTGNDQWFPFESENWDHEDLKSGSYQFRLKPQTITINGVEVPAPFDPKIGEWFYYLSSEHEGGYASRRMHDDTPKHLLELGVWPTEEKIKQVVSALKQAIHNKS